MRCFRNATKCNVAVADNRRHAGGALGSRHAYAINVGFFNSRKGRDGGAHFRGGDILTFPAKRIADAVNEIIKAAVVGSALGRRSGTRHRRARTRRARFSARTVRLCCSPRIRLRREPSHHGCGRSLRRVRQWHSGYKDRLCRAAARCSRRRISPALQGNQWATTPTELSPSQTAM